MTFTQNTHLLPGLVSLFATTFCDRAQLEKFRNRRLRLLLRHAYRNVPYYRQLFNNAGISPSEIQGTESLSKIPISFKKDLQPLTAGEILAAGIDPDDLILRRSSGTTGAPSSIRRTWFEERLLQAFRWRALLFFGLRPLDLIGVVERVRTVHSNDSQNLRRFINTLGFCRTKQIDCFLPFPEIIDQFEKNNFQVIGGLTGTLYHTALQINHAGRKITSPRFVFTGGETLLPHMRTAIEAAFGTQVCDTYGSHEFNLLAWQCRETGSYHLCDDSLIIEILKDGRPAAPGEAGEVIATSLFSWAMPFIRYHVGDVAVKGTDSCACGAAFSTVRELRGRSIDYLVLSDGRQLHPFQIIRFIVHPGREWVRQYQLVQESKDRIVLKVVPLGEVAPEILREFEENVRSMLGADTLFRTELVHAVDREPSGKFSVFKSLLSQDRPAVGTICSIHSMNLPEEL